ncbi:MULTISPECIES: glycine cleavage system aminomethyltransferase GcvT [Bacillus]|uniref:Aminomethyltransferase n=2 Tax=Bacillus TaxID=1386 RepID=A0A0M5JF66_9BACI|nr:MULTISPECIES: glycine cleavage system aminomethyltransferase GcvT [Bacillus]ALC83994.1 glycine cleavage system protein T [Bacillus gobiensis]MBP1082916.1 aminomethyltransferase [Bacillus capparidis]MED1098102.1 glycine cleavage system aminomethyltransferase GcvT [Bacillus capparidis]
MSTGTVLKRTPLFEKYIKYGAKVINFCGWELPVQFSSILEEHEAVRKEAGLFDVSHMGEVLVEGKGAESYINHLVTNDVTKLSINQAQYTAMCYPDGGTVDDLVVYKLANEKYLLVINAANIEKDYEWMELHLRGDVTLHNISSDLAQLAIQGPKAEGILQKLTATDLTEIGFFRFAQHTNLNGITDVLISRTGYTGEDGFELYLAADKAEALWDNLLEVGKEDGLKPCGLGARDTLRFEVRLALYGQELTNEISPLEAGIGFAVKTNKESHFIGKDILTAQKEEGLKRKLVGIEVTGRGIPRHGYKVFSAGEEEIGFITSGTHSPSLKKNLGLAIISAEHAEAGTQLKVEIRNKMIDAIVVKAPFYKNGS